MDAVVKGTSISVANSEKAKALQAALAQAEAEFREAVGAEVATVVSLGLEAYAGS